MKSRNIVHPVKEGNHPSDGRCKSSSVKAHLHCAPEDETWAAGILFPTSSVQKEGRSWGGFIETPPRQDYLTKKRCPECPVAKGGTHAAANPGLALRKRVALGEGLCPERLVQVGCRETLSGRTRGGRRCNFHPPLASRAIAQFSPSGGSGALRVRVSTNAGGSPTLGRGTVAERSA